jgi:hypothetical protein
LKIEGLAKATGIQILRRPSNFGLLPMTGNVAALHTLDGSNATELNSCQRSKSKKNVRAWSPDEDRLLLMGISRFGTNNWGPIVDMFANTRSRGQCSQRWFRCLDPAITKGRWNPEEDAMLLSVIRKYGSRNWVQVAREMKNRTDVQCRHRHLQLTKAHLETLERRVPLPPIKDLISRLLPREVSEPMAAGIAGWVC